MEYIIFMITIQVPFLYLIWRLFNMEQNENRKTLRTLKKQQEHVSHFIDTLKMSLERMSEDLYGAGKVNARFFKLEKNLKDIEEKLIDMEIYTGLNNKKASSFSPLSPS